MRNPETRPPYEVALIWTHSSNPPVRGAESVDVYTRPRLMPYLCVQWLIRREVAA